MSAKRVGCGERFEIWIDDAMTESLDRLEHAFYRPQCGATHPRRKEVSHVTGRTAKVRSLRAPIIRRAVAELERVLTPIMDAPMDDPRLAEEARTFAIFRKARPATPRVE